VLARAAVWEKTAMAQQPGRRAALVTGASYGIGAATAIGLAQDGFGVGVTDLMTGPIAVILDASHLRPLPLCGRG
jgi:NAD(P)-dependent dehydrogenase (short-subunit alcohol dehydrogenase family)